MLQRTKSGIEGRILRLGDTQRRHFAAFDPIVDLFPRSISISVRQIETEFLDIEWGEGRLTMTRDTGRFDERPDCYLQRLG